jgi:hypothetical protein
MCKSISVNSRQADCCAYRPHVPHTCMLTNMICSAVYTRILAAGPGLIYRASKNRPMRAHHSIYVHILLHPSIAMMPPGPPY